MLLAISAVLSLALIGTVGNSFATDQVIPNDLETRVASDGTAEDHLAAALLYQKEAQRAQAEVNKYQQTAASIRPIEDPKGFRRNALTTAAQTHQLYAGEMQQLYAAHQTKADTMLGKHQPQ
ncbi:MAG: hypothetical protein P0111_12075 [Nitrospira sp.]|nr:hypothetical protein [Nitrospira sp.]